MRAACAERSSDPRVKLALLWTTRHMDELGWCPESQALQLMSQETDIKNPVQEHGLIYCNSCRSVHSVLFAKLEDAHRRIAA